MLSEKGKNEEEHCVGAASPTKDYIQKRRELLEILYQTLDY